MENIKVFTSKFIQDIGYKLQEKPMIEKYIKGESPSFAEIDTKETTIAIESFPKLSVDLSPFENSRMLYEALQNIDRTLASDQRLWAWLSHVPFMEYMSKRWQVSGQPEEKRVKYITQHWFVNKQTAEAYLRHGIAMLWWGAYMTYDKKRDDPFELTREFFSLYDYTRMLTGSLGRSNGFVHALLDFVINNNEYFSHHKEDKVYNLMHKLNFIGAYKLLSALSETDFRKILEKTISEV